MDSDHSFSDLGFQNEFVDQTHLDLSADQLLLPAESFQHSFDEEVPQSSGGGKAVPPSQVKARNAIESNTDDYHKRRNRNNVAVKKSREKSKQKGATTVEKIERLKVENVELEEKVEVLNKELSVLKKVFMDHARGFSGVDKADLPDLDQLEKLLGHKLTDKAANSKNSGDGPSTSYS